MRAQFLFVRTRMNMADRHVVRFERHIFSFLPNVHETATLTFRDTDRGYIQVFGPQKARHLVRIYLVHLSASPTDIDAALWRATQRDPQLCRGMRSMSMSQMQIEMGFSTRLLSLPAVANLFAARMQQQQTAIQWRALPRRPQLALPQHRITPRP